ncbi:MAG: cell division protein FtsQ [Saprospiraceae bacterium]
MNSITASVQNGRVAELESSKNGSFIRVLIGITTLAIVGLTTGLLVDRLYQPTGFQLKKVALSGNPQHVDEALLKEAVVKALAGNYFSIDMAAIQQAMDEFVWVDEVSIRRRWPDTLMIDVTEHKPIARWGEDKLLTTKGKLAELPLVKTVWLPTLSGQADQHDYIYGQYQAWASAFSNQGLRLVSVKLSAQHLWTLQVEVLGKMRRAPFEMILLEANSSAQLDSFLKSIRQSLIEHPRGIERVDLRYSSGFSIKWAPQTKETQQ